MASRKNTASARAALGSADVAALESAAIAAVRSIESGYSAASKAIMNYVIGAKHASVTPAVFEAGMARISDAIPGVAKITVGAYVSNARRIFAADKDALAKAIDAAGTDSIKALAAACPAVSKAKSEGQAKRAAATPSTPTAPSAPADPKAPSAPVVATPVSDPILAVSNALVVMRRLAVSKKKARIILATIGEIEDMLDEVKSLMAA